MSTFYRVNPPLYMHIYHYIYIYTHKRVRRLSKVVTPVITSVLTLERAWRWFFSLYGDLRFAVTQQSDEKCYAFFLYSQLSIIFHWLAYSQWLFYTNQMDRKRRRDANNQFFWHIYKELALSLFFMSTSTLFLSNSPDFCRRLTAAFSP